MLNVDQSFAMTAQERRAPFGIQILGVLMMLAGILFAIAGAAFFIFGPTPGGPDFQSRGLTTIWAAIGAAAGVIFLAFGVLHAVLAIGLLQLRNAARVLAILLFALSAVGACLGMIATSLHFNQIAAAWNICLIGVDVWVLWYLLRAHTKKAFGA